MKDMDIDVLLAKAEELKALFTLGQRVIPFLEEIFIFVKDIKPLLDDINSSIEENLKKMPNASKQLSKVTEATEVATTEIMDIVDGLIYKADLISNNLKLMSDLEKKRRQSPLKALEILQDAADNDEDIQTQNNKIEKVIHDLKGSHGRDYRKAFKENEKLLESIKDDSNNIMMSLQVQDITSQQIAAVNHLLETIQDKLSGIIGRFQSSGMNEIISEEKGYERTNVSRLHRKIAFDPDAVESIKGKHTRQGEVDDYMKDINDKEEEEEEEEQEGSEVVSEDDIDALFAGGGFDLQEETGGEETSDESDEKTDSESEPEGASEESSGEEDDLTEFSQDDIDALFSGGNDDK